MKPIEEARNAHTLPGMVLSGCVKRARDGGREEGRGGGREDAHKNIPVSAPTMEPMEEARNAHTLPGMVSSGWVKRARRPMPNMTPEMSKIPTKIKA